jgi:hypothetical protein
MPRAYSEGGKAVAGLGWLTRIAGIEIVQAATFQRVSSGLLICGKLWVFALLRCALAPSRPLVR